MANYNAIEIEKKWRKIWEEKKLYKTDIETKKEKFYNLVMFPYPSGDKLHIGHWYNYGSADSFGRLKRLKGFEVFEPIGYDSFGLPAENYAFKTGVHPDDSTNENIKTMTKQLKEMGCMYDWDQTLETSSKEYYKWTQWIFLEMYKRGMAYKKFAPVNWCHSCQTVLANEQVQDGACERCKSEVTKKNLSQWFFRIRDYAEKLLNFEGLDWPEKTILMQKNWIGRSEGSELIFPLVVRKKIVLIHGFKANSQTNFFPWIKGELEKWGHEVVCLDLPGSMEGDVEAQVMFLKKEVDFDENTVVVGHSLGGVVAMKIAEEVKIAELILVCSFFQPKFKDGVSRDYVDRVNFEFVFGKIKENCRRIKIVSDKNDDVIPLEQGRFLQEKLEAELMEVEMVDPHARGRYEPEVLFNVLPAIKVFTTRIDTLFGCNYVVLAPENALVETIVSDENKLEVNEYIEKTKNKNDIERGALGKEKSGVFTGGYAINPLTGQKVQIWISDYVLMNYGTGAVMGVPAHDERDFEFARKYGLEMKKVVVSEGDGQDEGCMTNDGILVESGEFSGLKSVEAREKITEKLREIGLGRKTVNYKLRDWLVSRQRFWGVPIPVVYDEDGETVALEESELPVELPRDVDFKPTGDGKSPLSTSKEFMEIERNGKKFIREVDTLDTFVDSSWYFLRYPNARFANGAFDPKAVGKWLPVDMYIGGAEHACLHLLYARFVNMFLYDIGLVKVKEPFKKLFHQGMITKDGSKMSKSKGNVVNPDIYVNKYGSDVFRMYLMFLGPFDEGGDWNDQGISGIVRFQERFFNALTKEYVKINEEKMNFLVHKTIKKVGNDIERMQFNTAIAVLMEFVNKVADYGLSLEAKKMMCVAIAPLAPHLAEEIWSLLGMQFSVFNQSWPVVNESYLVESEMRVAVQVNGKVRGEIVLPVDAAEDLAFELALKDEKVRSFIDGKEIKKKIFVKGKLVSLVVN